MQFSRETRALVRRALAEDAATADVTTGTLITPRMQSQAEMVVKAGGVIAGLSVAALVFQTVDPSLEFTTVMPDGSAVSPGDRIAAVSGGTDTLLRAERTALNFVQHLSGIATVTSRYVREVDGLAARVVDTRKTTPGLRQLEKYAVRLGGGENHRADLAQAVLIKDNHLAALRDSGTDLAVAVYRARQNAPAGIVIEVEVTSPEDAVTAAQAGAEVVLLDNMGVDMMRRAVRAVAGRARLEASGGITLENVRAVAETGVDIISVGALTHSAPALDIGLDFRPL